MKNEQHRQVIKIAVVTGIALTSMAAWFLPAGFVPLAQAAGQDGAQGSNQSGQAATDSTSKPRPQFTPSPRPAAPKPVGTPRGMPAKPPR